MSEYRRLSSEMLHHSSSLEKNSFSVSVSEDQASFPIRVSGSVSRGEAGRRLGWIQRGEGSSAPSAGGLQCRNSCAQEQAVLKKKKRKEKGPRYGILWKNPAVSRPALAGARPACAGGSSPPPSGPNRVSTSQLSPWLPLSGSLG